MTKNKINSLITIVVIAIIGIGFFSSCNDDPIVERNNIDQVILKAESGGVSILKLQRGDRQGEWPRQYCEGKKTLCGLWFQAKETVVDINTAYATFYVENNNLYLDVNYSHDENISSWSEDVKNGYLEINNEIILDDPEFLSEINSPTPIVLPAGKYEIFNVRGELFSVIINYLITE